MSSERYRIDYGECERLTADEERDLAARAKAGDRQAVELLVRSVLPLAIKIAMPYKPSVGYEPQDIQQVAALAVVDCLGDFDPNKSRLTTFIFFHVRKSMQRFLRFHEIISTPKDVSRNKATRIESLRVVSISGQLSAGDRGMTIGDTIVRNAPEPIEELAIKELSVNIGCAMDSIGERESFVLRHIAMGYKTREIAVMLNGVSRERIQQIKNRAVRLLAAMLRVPADCVQEAVNSLMIYRRGHAKRNPGAGLRRNNRLGRKQQHKLDGVGAVEVPA